MPFTATCIDLENIMLSEVGQRRDKHPVISQMRYKETLKPRVNRNEEQKCSVGSLPLEWGLRGRQDIRERSSRTMVEGKSAHSRGRLGARRENTENWWREVDTGKRDWCWNIVCLKLE